MLLSQTKDTIACKYVNVLVCAMFDVLKMLLKQQKKRKQQFFILFFYVTLILFIFFFFEMTKRKHRCAEHEGYYLSFCTAYTYRKQKLRIKKKKLFL